MAQKHARAGGESLAELAYRQLREQVIACAIPPGSLITESQLADELGVGKTPAREALRRLVAEGFVEPIHRRGYRVVPITIARVEELFEAFGLLVPEVGVLVAERASAAEKRRLDELTRAWLANASSGQLRPTPYRFFVQLCGNPTVAAMATRIVGHLERTFNFALAHGALVDEAYLEATRSALEAIEDARGDAVRAALRRLTDTSRDSVIAALRTSPSVMTTPVEMHPGANPTAA